MENGRGQEFIKKFNELTPQNQKYLICIQQALSFAQGKTEESAANNSEKDQQIFG